MISRSNVIFGLLGCISLYGEIVPTPGTQDVRALFDRADLVCSAFVESVEVINPQRATTGQELEQTRATLRVRQFYKSNGPQRETIAVEGNEGQLYKGEKLVLFATSTGPGTYVLADPYIGATRFQSLETPSNGKGLEALKLLLARVLEQPNSDDRVSALKLLQGCDNLPPEAIKSIIPLASSEDPEIAFAALAVLLKSGSARDVERVRRYLQTFSAGSAPITITSLASELSRVRDEKALPALCSLSRSSFLSIRIGTLQALRRIRSARAAPCLIDRLSDSNSYVSYLGLITLAETFGKYGDYAPNMELFDRNPGFYVGLWKAWWVQEETELQTTPSDQKVHQ